MAANERPDCRPSVLVARCRRSLSRYDQPFHSFPAILALKAVALHDSETAAAQFAGVFTRPLRGERRAGGCPGRRRPARCSGISLAIQASNWPVNSAAADVRTPRRH
jgi:hypothetical protein